MLSTVAERIYWMARYLERVECTARLVQAYANLMLDLPKEINISWYNLVVLNSCAKDYSSRYPTESEGDVVKFLLLLSHV